MCQLLALAEMKSSRCVSCWLSRDDVSVDSFTPGGLLADGFAKMAIMDHHLSLGVALSSDRPQLRRVRGATAKPTSSPVGMIDRGEFAAVGISQKNRPS